MSAGVSSETNDLDHAAQIFTEVRPRLFGITYRMLGSASEAEDIVQDAWLRWQSYDRSTVINPPAFLATIATRLAITAAQSARSRHETYIGPWLPEPVDTSQDPQLGAERGEALGFAVLLLLEKLTPTERAAYVLREAFDYSYTQITEVIQLKEPAVRVEANGQPSVALSRDDVVFAVVTVSATAEGIHQLLWMMNPARLAGFRPLEAGSPAHG